MAKRICGKRLPTGGVCTRPAGCTIIHAAATVAMPVVSQSREIAAAAVATEITPEGVQTWKDAEGQLHRGGDQPAVIWVNGSKFWYRHGILHRDGDQPAEIWASGIQKWYYLGELHREDDRPALTDGNGWQEWWIDGKRHRDGDRPAVIYGNGSKEWWVDGKLVRKSDS